MRNYIMKNIDDNLWKKVKILCIKRDITIKKLILTFLEKEVEKGE